MNWIEKRSQWLQALWHSFCIVSVLFAVCQLLRISADLWQNPYTAILAQFADAAEKTAPYWIAFALPYHLLPGTSAFSGVWSAFCFCIYHSMFTAITGAQTGILWAILLGLLTVQYTQRAGDKRGRLLSLITAIILGILFGLIHKPFEVVCLSLLNKIGNRSTLAGTLYGILQTLLQPLSATVNNLIDYHSPGGAIWTDGKIITGAKNIFHTLPNASAAVLFLAGKGLQLFLVSGFSFALSDGCTTRTKYAITVLTVGCLLSGHTELFLLFLLFESPFLFMAFVGLSGVCYLVASRLSLHWGFLQSGGLTEFLIYNHSGLQPILVGVVFCVLSYFVCRYLRERYGIAEDVTVRLPKHLQWLVKELGGLQNICGIENKVVQVRNAKRINTLLLEGELKGNQFISEDKQIQELKEYLDFS